VQEEAEEEEEGNEVSVAEEEEMSLSEMIVKINIQDNAPKKEVNVFSYFSFFCMFE
jgi:hypothetical protein